MNYKEKIKAIQCLLDNPDNVGAYYTLNKIFSYSGKFDTQTNFEMRKGKPYS